MFLKYLLVFFYDSFKKWVFELLVGQIKKFVMDIWTLFYNQGDISNYNLDPV